MYVPMMPDLFTQDSRPPAPPAGRFLTALHVMSVGDLWRLMAPLVYATRDGEVIRVPTGYYTDLFSIPRPLRWLFDTDGYAREASVVHDYIYTHLTARYTRAEADAIFHEALAAIDERRGERSAIARAADGLRRWSMWSGVRIGGRGNW